MICADEHENRSACLDFARNVCRHHRVGGQTMGLTVDTELFEFALCQIGLPCITPHYAHPTGQRLFGHARQGYLFAHLAPTVNELTLSLRLGFNPQGTELSSQACGTQLGLLRLELGLLRPELGLLRLELGLRGAFGRRGNPGTLRVVAP